jgi:polar amino acid transport system substrate-binding protein
LPHRAALLVVLAVLMAAPAIAASPQVFIPGFWDPQTIPATPDLEPGMTIRFVTADDYPPFNYARPDGSLTGFNVDLARALCEELGASCTVQARPWDNLVPALDAGEADAAIASLAITAAARRTADFTGAYYRTPARFAARTTEPLDTPSPAALAGRKVAVAAGTAQEAYLKAFFPKAVLLPQPNPDVARAALKDGKADFLFDDGVGAAIWLGSDAAAGCCAFKGGPYTESRFFGEGAGIAVRKGDTTLRRALDYALARLARKGIYADLYLKYFPIGFY